MMEKLGCIGSTSEFFRVAPGVVIKSPMKVWTGNPNHKKIEAEMKSAIAFESKVLERLTPHPRIVPYLGVEDESGGIRLQEASHGSLQAYIDNNNDTITDSQRWRWAVQAVERLMHGTDEQSTKSSPSLELWLCDFGGSRCDDLGYNLVHLPDEPFFDPRMPWDSFPATDIFSLGSMLYTILTGHWPYLDGPPLSSREEKDAYNDKVNKLFKASMFPDVSDLKGGDVIWGCWQHCYKTAEEVLKAINAVN